jgi:NAD(P)-dependent dehydrogenase (short-subunit alcohol dehydrogenase family)
VFAAPPVIETEVFAAITRSLAVAYAPQLVNAIAPSATMTDRVEALVAGNTALQKLADSHLLGLMEPGDIANCALYLASNESRMVTGQVVPVDSGVTIS